jgi:hypothetical protein
MTIAIVYEIRECKKGVSRGKPVLFKLRNKYIHSIFVSKNRFLFLARVDLIPWLEIY